jgi:hypothetical protein
MAGGELRRGGNALVRFVEADVEEKGFRLVAVVVEPVDGFVHHDLAGVAFHLAQGLAIAHEVDGVAVRGGGVVARGQPMVVAVVAGVGPVARAVREVVAEMPFPHMGGGVSTRLEEFGHGGFLHPQVHVLGGGHPTVYSRPHGEASRLQGGPRGRAYGAGGVEVAELESLRGQFVEVGRLVLGAAVATEVARPKVIGEYEHDVGLILRRGKKRAGKKGEKRGEGFHVGDCL